MIKVDKNTTAKTTTTAKPAVVRALVQLVVTNFGDSKFPSDQNLSQAVANHAANLGYDGVGTTTISDKSDDKTKIIEVAAVDIEPMRLVGILDDVLKNFLNNGFKISFNSVKGPISSEFTFRRMTKAQYKASKVASAGKNTADVKSDSKAKTVKTAEPKAAKSVTKGFTPLSRKTMNKRFLEGALTRKQRKIAKREIVQTADGQSIHYAFQATGGDNYSASEELYLLERLLKKFWPRANAKIEGDKLLVDNIASPEDVLNTKAVLTPFKYSEENHAKLEEWLTGGGLGWVAMWVGERGLLFYGFGDLTLRDPPLE